MTTSATHPDRFVPHEWSEIETDLDSRLATAAGPLGLALIEVVPSELAGTEERLVAHLEPEDHTARIGHNRFVIVRCPLTGPAEMEGLGLRIADSFPAPATDDGSIRRSTVNIGVVTGRRGDGGDTLLRHAQYGLDDAKIIGRPMVAVDDGPRLPDGART